MKNNHRKQKIEHFSLTRKTSICSMSRAKSLDWWSEVPANFKDTYYQREVLTPSKLDPEYFKRKGFDLSNQRVKSFANLIHELKIKKRDELKVLK